MVQFTTSLPLPSDVSASLTDSNSVTLSWTNNHTTSNGSIRIKRSSDGGTSFTTLASGLSTTTTSYTDTTVSIGQRYIYRVDRVTADLFGDVRLQYTTDDPNVVTGSAVSSGVEIVTVPGGGTTLVTSQTDTLASAQATSDGALSVEGSSGTLELADASQADAGVATTSPSSNFVGEGFAITRDTAISRVNANFSEPGVGLALETPSSRVLTSEGVTETTGVTEAGQVDSATTQTSRDAGSANELASVSSPSTIPSLSELSVGSENVTVQSGTSELASGSAGGSEIAAVGAVSSLSVTSLVTARTDGAMSVISTSSKEQANENGGAVEAGAFETGAGSSLTAENTLAQASASLSTSPISSVSETTTAISTSRMSSVTIQSSPGSTIATVGPDTVSRSASLTALEASGKTQADEAVSTLGVAPTSLTESSSGRESATVKSNTSHVGAEVGLSSGSSTMSHSSGSDARSSGVSQEGPTLTTQSVVNPVETFGRAVDTSGGEITPVVTALEIGDTAQAETATMSAGPQSAVDSSEETTANEQLALTGNSTVSLLDEFTIGAGGATLLDQIEFSHPDGTAFTSGSISDVIGTTSVDVVVDGRIRENVQTSASYVTPALEITDSTQAESPAMPVGTSALSKSGGSGVASGVTGTTTSVQTKSVTGETVATGSSQMSVSTNTSVVDRGLVTDQGGVTAPETARVNDLIGNVEQPKISSRVSTSIKTDRGDGKVGPTPILRNAVVSGNDQTTAREEFLFATTALVSKTIEAADGAQATSVLDGSSITPEVTGTEQTNGRESPTVGVNPDLVSSSRTTASGQITHTVPTEFGLLSVAPVDETVTQRLTETVQLTSDTRTTEAPQVSLRTHMRAIEGTGGGQTEFLRMKPHVTPVSDAEAIVSPGPNLLAVNRVSVSDRTIAVERPRESIDSGITVESSSIATESASTGISTTSGVEENGLRTVVESGSVTTDTATGVTGSGRFTASAGSSVTASSGATATASATVAPQIPTASSQDIAESGVSGEQTDATVTAGSQATIKSDGTLGTASSLSLSKNVNVDAETTAGATGNVTLAPTSNVDTNATSVANTDTISIGGTNSLVADELGRATITPTTTVDTTSVLIDRIVSPEQATSHITASARTTETASGSGDTLLRRATKQDVRDDGSAREAIQHRIWTELTVAEFGIHTLSASLSIEAQIPDVFVGLSSKIGEQTVEATYIREGGSAEYENKDDTVSYRREPQHVEYSDPDDEVTYRVRRIE